MDLEEQSSINRSQENEKVPENKKISPENSNNNIKSIIQPTNIIYSKITPINNISSQNSKIPSKAQIYHYEKTIHDLTLQNTSLTNRIEKLLLQLEKSNALIDSNKTENDILKSQLVNQTNNNKILEQKNLEKEKEICELKTLNENIVKNNKIKYESLNKEISEKEKKINKLNE